MRASRFESRSEIGINEVRMQEHNGGKDESGSTTEERMGKE
jgi:hypothetical protein